MSDSYAARRPLPRPYLQPQSEAGYHRKPDVIVMVGPQGVGKSTLARGLHTLLRHAGFTPRWLNQDEIGPRNQYLKAVEQAATPSSGATHIILDKMHLTESQRCDYPSLTVTLCVELNHPKGQEALLKLCLDRLKRRGEAHRSFVLTSTSQTHRRDGDAARKKGIVVSGVRSYEASSGENVFQVDCQQNQEAILRQVWEELMATGTHPLPAIGQSTLCYAIDVAMKYENALLKHPTKVIYASIDILDYEEVLQLIPQPFLSDKKVQKEFHVTTKFVKGDTDPEIFVKLADLLGTTIALTLVRIVSNENATAIIVRNSEEFPCANKIAHITVACAEKVSPVYSNQLCALPADSQGLQTMELPEETTVRGVFRFH